MQYHYRTTIERVYQLFLTCPDPNKKEKADGWTIKQIVGHLVDSLSNNHQRLARYMPGEEFRFPGYEQNVFVQRAHYDTFDFQTLLALWYQYNQLFLHILAHLPEEHLATPVLVGDRPPMPLEQLIQSYFDHIEKHAQQVRRISNA